MSGFAARSATPASSIRRGGSRSTLRRRELTYGYSSRIVDLMTRAALYARLSRDRTGEETATARQLDDCRAFATSRGWDIVGEYSDADVSAFRRNADRPGYKSMLGELDAGRVDIIVSWRLDRLLRRFTDLSDLWKRCERVGAHLVTVRDGIDTSTPIAGKLVAVIMSAVAEVEAESLSVREMRKHEETAKRGGRSGGGHRPFGLTRDWSTLVDDEAALVRDAVERILKGESMYSIAREWNAAGVRTPTGKHWTVQHLVKMLRSPRIAGLRVHRGAIVAQGQWPAIISPEDHAKLLALIEGRRRPGAPGRFLLSGLVRCGRCGSTMVIRRRHADKARHYGCEKVNGRASCGGTHIMAEPLEDLVSEMVLTAIDSPALAEALSASGVAPEEKDLIAQLRADEAALEQLARDHYVDRLIDRPEFLTARDALEARVTDARRRLASSSSRSVLIEAGGARSRWGRLDVDKRRAIIAAILDGVVIGPARRGATRFDPERVQPSWRY